MSLTIKFTRKWTKLNTAPGGLFTTIRRSYQEKAEYYRSHIGDTFNIDVNGNNGGMARLLAVFRGPAESLPGPLLSYDTDGDLTWIGKIKRSDEVLVLLFQKCGDECL